MDQSLRSLNLSAMSGDEMIVLLPTLVRRFPNLENINFSYCYELTDVRLAHLRGMNLRTLDLCGCSISHAGLAHLRGMTNLKTLNLGGCRVTDDGLNHLLGMNSLEILDLTGGIYITDVGLANLRRMTNLQTLNLCSCRNLTDVGLANLQ